MASDPRLAPRPSSPAPRPSPLVPRPPTVFIVDDDTAVLEGLARLLRSAGLAVATFSEIRGRGFPDQTGGL
jgi:hypothetical protein